MASETKPLAERLLDALQYWKEDSHNPSCGCARCEEYDALLADHAAAPSPVPHEVREAAERINSNCWDEYLGDPPRDWPAIFDRALSDARTVSRAWLDLNDPTRSDLDWIKSVWPEPVYLYAEGNIDIGSSDHTGWGIVTLPHWTRGKVRMLASVGGVVLNENGEEICK